MRKFKMKFKMNKKAMLDDPWDLFSLLLFCLVFIVIFSLLFSSQTNSRVEFASFMVNSINMELGSISNTQQYCHDFTIKGNSLIEPD